MADPTDYLEFSGAIAAGGGEATYAIPETARKLTIKSDNAATTMSTSAGGDHFLLGVGPLVLEDPNLGGHNLYFDDGTNVYIIAQLGMMA